MSPCVRPVVFDVLLSMSLRLCGLSEQSERVRGRLCLWSIALSYRVDWSEVDNQFCSYSAQYKRLSFRQDFSRNPEFRRQKDWIPDSNTRG